MITIIGGGLTGPFLAIALTKRGFKVELFEKINKSKVKKTRSINLSLSERGMSALGSVGLDKKLADVSVKTLGRVIHFPKEVINKYNYSKDSSDYLYTVERENLQNILYDECKRLNIDINKGLECKDYNPSNNNLTIYDDNKNISFNLKRDVIIGADGSNSIIRQRLEDNNLIDVSRKFSSYGYKKFFIPKSAVEDLKLDAEYVHFWPRNGYFCMGLANIDGSMTGGIVLPKEQGIGEIPFFNMNDTSFWKSIIRDFPNLAHSVPNLRTELKNPISNFSMSTCSTWYYSNKCCLVGDAAHSILPWHAQGINCGLAECVKFVETLIKFPDNFEKVFQVFEDENKENANAIAKLSENNFEELLWNIKPISKNITQLSPQLAKKMKIYRKVAFSKTPYAQILNELNLLKDDNFELGTSEPVQSWVA